MLEVKDLTRHYGSFKAVDNVSFSIEKGEIVGLLGHNGAGKTTIMKMISGYLEPNNGEVNLQGKSIKAQPKEVQRLIGYLPENLPVYPEMTVADYLDYAADLKGLKNNHKKSEIIRAIKATDIGTKLLSPIAKLSRGFKQRVGVAQAILGDPKLLILDEPTNGLDPQQTEHMRQLILEIAKDATVILSTHIMQEVDALCSRVLIVRGGQLAVDSNLEDLRHSHSLIVETNMPLDEAAFVQNIQGLIGVKYLSSVSGSHASYRIELTTGASVRKVSQTLAKGIIEAGYELYLLKPEQRDLETLFREVNSDKYSISPNKFNNQGGVSHAA